MHHAGRGRSASRFQMYRVTYVWEVVLLYLLAIETKTNLCVCNPCTYRDTAALRFSDGWVRLRHKTSDRTNYKQISEKTWFLSRPTTTSSRVVRSIGGCAHGRMYVGPRRQAFPWALLFALRSHISHVSTAIRSIPRQCSGATRRGEEVLLLYEYVLTWCAWLRGGGISQSPACHLVRGSSRYGDNLRNTKNTEN